MITVSSKIIKVARDDTLLSKEAFFSQVEKAIADAKEGKTYSMKPNESLDDFLTSPALSHNQYKP